MYSRSVFGSFISVKARFETNKFLIVAVLMKERKITKKTIEGGGGGGGNGRMCKAYVDMPVDRTKVSCWTFDSYSQTLVNAQDRVNFP